MVTDRELQTHKALGDVSRSRILEELRGHGRLDSRQLGSVLGLHPNTIRSHVDRLIEAGLVRETLAPPAGRGRPRVLYEAVNDLVTPNESGYRLLAQILAGYLATIEHPEVVAESAGRVWGRHLTERPQPFARVSAEEATQKVVRLFSELGFRPEAVDSAGRRKILLHRCPFRQVAESNQTVACAVHLGMLKGALAEMGAPLEATRLEPFVEPSLCVAHLRERAERPPLRPAPATAGG